MSALPDQFKYLLYQSYAIGLLPKFNRNNNKFEKCTYVPLFYVIFVLTTFLYTLWPLVSHLPAVITFNASTRMVQHVIINLIYIEFFLAHHRFKFDKLQLLWENLQRIDIDFRTYFKFTPEEIKYITAKLFITNITYILLHAFYFWTQQTFHAGVFFLNEIFVKFGLHTSKFIISHMYSAIRSRLKGIGDVLERNDAQKLSSMEVLINIHTRCTDAIDLCNDLYGINLAISVLHLVLYALRLVSLFLEGPKDDKDKTMLLMLVLWTLYGFVCIFPFKNIILLIYVF